MENEGKQIHSHRKQRLRAELLSLVLGCFPEDLKKRVLCITLRRQVQVGERAGELSLGKRDGKSDVQGHP